MLEDRPCVNDVEAVVRKGKCAISFDYRGMVQERVRQDRVVDITAFDMGASTSEVEQFAPILDLVIEDVLASTCAEVQNSVGGTQDRIDVGIQGDA